MCASDMANATSSTNRAATAPALSVNIGALFESRNDSTICPFVGTPDDDLIVALEPIANEHAWRLFTSTVADGSLLLYAALVHREVGGTAPYMRTELGRLYRTSSDSTPYRFVPNAELAAAVGDRFPSGIATWHTSAAGNSYLSLWMPEQGASVGTIRQITPRQRSSAS